MSLNAKQCLIDLVDGKFIHHASKHK